MMNLAGKIDHTLLKPDADHHQIRKLVQEAKVHHFASVCVNGCYVGEVAGALAGTQVKTCAVVGFPLGANRRSIKAAEATIAVGDGAQEIDFVAHLPYLIACDLNLAVAEFSEVVNAARLANPDVIIKVIIESARLLQDGSQVRARIETACLAAQHSGCDFVKTSTGFHPAGGASAAAVAMIKQFCGPLRVKASGGIRSYDDAMRMIEAGADRLGCSEGVAIVTAGGPQACQSA